ncbi:unnamed protein product [Mytilus edulis]|uniref:Mitochondria-eating protein C-terminal domain-containing protein n=1 Tax=Mytilus edulis TaxID=6550 RepID=A0A8S3SP71_MYTED|nr:unnamed protein product [Mytilus edulis]
MEEDTVEDEEDRKFQQLEEEFCNLETFLRKCKKLLRSKITYKMYPTKTETEGAISSLQTIISTDEEIENDVKLVPEFLGLVLNRKWKQVKKTVLSVCMELDAAECKYLKRDTESALLRFGIEPEEILKYDTELSEECIDESLPTQMAKQFCVIYDVNWSEAFSQAKQHFVDDKEDEEIIKDIATLTQLVFDYFKIKVTNQVKQMTTVMTKIVTEPIIVKQKSSRTPASTTKSLNTTEKEYKTVLPYARLAVRDTIRFSLPVLMKEFTATQISRQLKPYLSLDKVNNFIENCSQFSWNINVMETPMVLVWPTDATKNKLFHYFRYFTKFGTDFDHGVWPALLLNEDGPTMVRAVNDRLNPFVFQTEVVFKYQLKKELEITIMSKFSFSVLDRFIHDVQKPVAHPTSGDAKRASSAIDDIINNVPLIDELNVKGLRDLIKLAEKGKFTDMKNKASEAISDYQIIESFYKKKVLPTSESIDSNEKEKQPKFEEVTDLLLNPSYKLMDNYTADDRPHGQDLVNSRLLHQHNTTEINERRDQEASFSIHNQNPMITDISDTNRPTKVAEQFSALYDNEWTDAFDAIARLEGKKANIEKEIIIYLDDVLRNIYVYTVKRVPALVDNIALQLEQTMLDPVSSTKEKDFKKTELRPSLQKYQDNFNVNKYMDKCIEICWFMNVLDPPMVLKWPMEHQNAEDLVANFRHYTKAGIQLDFAVWPALLFYDQGPLVVKGVMQMK